MQVIDDEVIHGLFNISHSGSYEKLDETVKVFNAFFTLCQLVLQTLYDFFYKTFIKFFSKALTTSSWLYLPSSLNSCGVSSSNFCQVVIQKPLPSSISNSHQSPSISFNWNNNWRSQCQLIFVLKDLLNSILSNKLMV